MAETAEGQTVHVYAECAVYVKNPAGRQQNPTSTRLPPLGLFYLASRKPWFAACAVSPASNL